MRRAVKILWHSERGMAVVEATILFPIIMMIFAGLVLLSMYLPTRSALQRATQYAATAIATERADTWLGFDEKTMEYKWLQRDEVRNPGNNVYMAFLRSFLLGEAGDYEKVKTIVTKVEAGSISMKAGELEVDFDVVNRLVYKEIIVTASRTIDVPIDLSFVMFPDKIEIKVASTAVVLNGDEFVRSMDLAVDYVKFLDREFGISTGAAFGKVNEVRQKFDKFLGI
ncbi:MAG: pilus assembly protein [Oscillospiraceae bacterium]|nr:pilus assembly protein [Oscillospiraceae bacterium]